MILKTKRSIAGRMLALVALSVGLFSFSGNFGADSYQIFINNKLVLKDYVTNQTSVKSFQLDPASANDEIEVYYSHCGQIGKGRAITIKDGQNRTVKSFQFAEATGKNTGMSFKSNEISSAKNVKSSGALQLIYSSKEIPEGRLLANIVVGNDATASRGIRK